MVKKLETPTSLQGERWLPCRSFLSEIRLTVASAIKLMLGMRDYFDCERDAGRVKETKETTNREITNSLI